MSDKKLFLFILSFIIIIGMLLTVSADMRGSTRDYYTLDGSSPIDSVGTTNLTNHGATTGVTGIINTAYSFDGSSNYLGDIPNTALTSSGFSINMWIKNTGSDTDMVFLGGQNSGTNGFLFGYGSTTVCGGGGFGVTFIGGGGTNCNPGISFDSSSWYMITTTYDGTTSRIYVNGVNVGNATTTLHQLTVQPYNIARRGGIADGYFNGVIDEIAVFNSSISTTNITYLYNLGVPGTAQQFPFTGGSTGLPSITLNSPPDGYLTTNRTETFNVTVNSSSGNLFNVSLYTDGILNETNTSGINGTYLFTPSQFSEGTHIWFINACDLNGCTNSTNRTFTDDDILPNITIQSPNETFNYLYTGKNLTLNFTATDNIGLSTCWYSYANVNKSISCSNNTLVNTNFSYTSPYNNLTVYVNDTVGNVFSQLTSWSYKILELNKSFNSDIIGGNFENFSLYIIKSSSINVNNITLNYAGTDYSSSVYSSGNNVQGIKELFISNPASDTNNTLYFSIGLNDGTVINTTNGYQMVRSVSIDDCSTKPYKFLNLTLLDEGNQSSIYGEIEVDLHIINSITYQDILNLSADYTNVTGKNFCSNQYLNQSGFLLTATIRYSASNYSAEFYNIQRSDLEEYPKTYYLYDLNSDDSTPFKITYRGDNLVGVDGAILQLQRQYVSEGVYKTVEAPLTSSDSTAVVHIDTNTHLYKVTFVKNGVVLNTFDNLVFSCQSILTGECTLELDSSVIPPNSVSLESLQDFSYSITSSIDNQTITLSYSVPSGTTSTVQVLANQTDIVGTETICNTTISSAAGSIECNYNQSIENSYINYYVYKDGKLIAQKAYVVEDDVRTDFGGDNYFILVIFVISLIFMAILSPEWIVLNVIISVIIGGATWLIRGMDFVLGLGTVAWLIFVGVIIIIKMAQKEDQ